MSLLLRRAAGATGGTAGSGGGDDGPPPVDPGFPTSSATWADRLVDIAGVNVHLDYGPSGGYTNVYKTTGLGQSTKDATLAQAFQLLGIRHARDTLITSSTNQRNAANALHTAAGVDFKMACGYGGSIPSISAVQSAIAAYDAGVIESVTPPNEINNNGPADWVARLTSFQADLWNAYGGSGIRVGTGPLTLPKPYNDNFSGQPFQNQCDFIDLHPYPGGQEPANQMDAFITAGRRMATKVPEFSEESYHNATQSTDNHLSAPENVAGIYFARLLLEAWSRGVNRCETYELADQYPEPALTNPQRHFGLFRYGWIPKPAAYAYAHLMFLHADPGSPYSPAPLPIKVGGPSDLRWTIFGKRDGSYVVDFWRAGTSIWTPAKSGAGTAKTVSPQTVTVTLPAEKTLTRYMVDGTPGYSATPYEPRAADIRTDLTVGFNVAAETHVLTIA